MTKECWFFAKPGKIIKKTPDIRAARSALGAPGSVNEVLPMRQSRFLPRIFRLGLGLAAVAALSWWAAHVAAQTSSHDPVEQTHKVMQNIKQLIEECGGTMDHLVKVVVYLTDVRHREQVYRRMGEYIKGVHPVSTGIVVQALARPEWLVEIDGTAVIPD